MDVRGNKVKLDDNTEISYDKCLIATGKPLLKRFHYSASGLNWTDANVNFVFRRCAKKSAGH